jgi:hypothetical protein
LRAGIVCHSFSNGNPIIEIFIQCTNDCYLNVPGAYERLGLRAPGLINTTEADKYGKHPVRIRRRLRPHTVIPYGSQPHALALLHINELFLIPASGRYTLYLKPRIYVLDADPNYISPRVLPEMSIDLNLVRNYALKTNYSGKADIESLMFGWVAAVVLVCVCCALVFRKKLSYFINAFQKKS